MNSFFYLTENFLTLQQLAMLTGVGADRILAMIEAGCVPGPAYRLEGGCRITSIFGPHDEDLDLAFFPRSHIARVAAVERSGLDWPRYADTQKQAFMADYKQALIDLRAADFGLGGLFLPDGTVGGKAADDLLEKEWGHYLDGTYGLCTRTALARDIAVKEAMIAKIKFLEARLGADPLSPFLRSELEQAVDMLDEVSSVFAPHERARSSRHLYVDQVRGRLKAASESAA